MILDPVFRHCQKWYSKMCCGTLTRKDHSHPKWYSVLSRNFSLKPSVDHMSDHVTLLCIQESHFIYLPCCFSASVLSSSSACLTFSYTSLPSTALEDFQLDLLIHPILCILLVISSCSLYHKGWYLRNFWEHPTTFTGTCLLPSQTSMML